MRCSWLDETSEIYVKYHDEEWGKPEHNDRKLFEMLVLEGFQAGLAWITVLKKREAFRLAFDNFEPEIVAKYEENKITQLLNNPQIIRSRQKICAAIGNAKVFMQIQAEFGSFANYIWGFTQGQTQRYNVFPLPASNELSDKISRDLKKRGMKYVGSVIVYSYLQAIGVINDHEPQCICHIKS